MYNQIDVCQTNNENRGFCSEQEMHFEMNGQTPLTPDERQLLANQTGQLLVAIGNLLASQSVGSDGSSRTGKNLVSIGRKLISASKSANSF